MRGRNRTSHPWRRSVDRRSSRRRRRLSIETLEPRQVLSANVLVTEVMASNGESLADGDGNFSDWIELYNPTQETVNLAGWHLTDEATNLDKWTFPALPQSVLEPGEFLIVFASGQLVETYVDPGGYLHTDFALAAEGEYLALTDANDAIVHEYAPQIPDQRRDVSYGVIENIITQELIGPSTPSTAHVPTSSALDAPAVNVPPAWTLPGFNDATWLTGNGPGVGYDQGDAPVPIIPNGTVLPGGLVGNDFTDPDQNGADGTVFVGGPTNWPANEEPPKSVDNTTATKWLTFAPAGTFWGFRFSGGQRHAVSAYTITSANDEPNRDPYTWTLAGSNDGVNYTILDTRTAQTFSSRFQTRLYQFNNSAAFEYYRFDLQTRFGVTGQNQPVAIQVAEFELLSNGQVDFTPQIDVDVAAAWTAAKTSAYQRIDFNVADPAALATLRLDMLYDDGFVAYLNGKRVASALAPTLPTFQSHATGQREDTASLEPQSFNLTPFLGDLIAGENVLAIHLLNFDDASPDLLSHPRLVATELVDATLAKVFMDQPTPGATNVGGYAGIVADPQFSVERGFFEAPFQLTITAPTAGSKVYYTTDGSEPTPTNGALYSAPIAVNGTSTIRAQAFRDGDLDSTTTTKTYLFVNDIVRQTPAATIARGFPTTWGPYTADYGLDPDVIGTFNSAGVSTGGDDYGGIYAATIKNDLKAIPTLSIVMDFDDLFGPSGIYSNAEARGEAWERATSVELINPDGSPGFQIDAGLRMHGGAFRRDNLSKKHSFRLAFRGQYEGNTQLEFPLFGEDAAAEFDGLVLRMDSNDGYAWDAAGSRAQYARDEFGRRTQADLGQVSPHGMRVHLYINGAYWGLYNPVERPDASFSASYYGGDKEDWDALEQDGVSDGTGETWNTLLSLSQAVRSATTEAAKTTAYMRVLGLNANGTDNPTFETYLDAVNYVDYLTVNFFMGNNDWPHRNWWASRMRGPESDGFKFHMWDAETVMRLNSDVNTNRLGAATHVAEPYDDLKTSLEFRTLFGDRVHRAFFNGGVMSTAANAARYQEVIGEISQAIVAESARWGDMHFSTPLTKAQWQAEANSVISWLNSRTSIFLNQLRSAGLYSSVTAPTFSQHGGEIGQGAGLTMTAPAGAIWYTTDGSDPRLIGGGVNPNAKLYNAATPPQITSAVTLRARALSSSTWSALNEAEFTTSSTPDGTNLRITEIHYNPAAHNGLTDEQDLEFIELFNPSAAPVSLDGVEIMHFVTEGYAFPAGLTLDAGQRIIVARNPAVFQSVYGNGLNVSPLGYGDANLANSGERIALVAPGGLMIQDFSFDDGGGWPTAADGNGKSLEIIDPFGDASSPANWRASYYTGGSPGTSGAAPAVGGDFDGDGDVDGNDFLRWQQNLGRPALTTEASQGDADGDRDVDSADLTMWRINHGTVTPAPIVANATAVGLAASDVAALGQLAAPVESPGRMPRAHRPTSLVEVARPRYVPPGLVPGWQATHTAVASSGSDTSGDEMADLDDAFASLVESDMRAL
jgi:hypothetical protein